MRRPLALVLLVVLCACGSRPGESVRARAAAPPTAAVVVSRETSTTTSTTSSTTTTSTTVRPRPRPAPRPAPVVHAVSYRPVAVDAGTFRRIGGCESSGSPTGPLLWTKTNPHSTASGAYQDLDSTWISWARTYGADVGASSYRRAMDAPPDVQIAVNERAYEAEGTGPWAASRGCWG